MPPETLQTPPTVLPPPAQEQPSVTESRASGISNDVAKELVSSRYENGKQAAIPYLTKAARYYRLFRNVQTQKNYTGLANLFVPEPYRVIAKKTAKLGNAIKSITATPETPADKESASVGTHLLSFLRRKLNWNTLERIAIQESRIVGMSWIKVLWNINKEDINKPYKGFDLTFDTIDHVILPPDLTIQDIMAGAQIPWLVHAYQADLSELRKNPNYSAQAIRTLETRSGNQSSRRAMASVLEQARVMFQQAQKAYTIKDAKKFNILEYWGYMPNRKLNSDGTYTTELVDCLIAIADKDVVLRNDKNPYAEVIDERIPFVPFVGRIVGQEANPVGDLEPAESLFNELNDTRNQRMDTVTLNIDPPKEIIRAANIDDKDLVARRGWYIKSNIPNGIRFIPPAMQGVVAAMEEEKVIRGDIQQVTGVLDFNQSSDVQAGVEVDTARGALIAKGEADVLAEEELDLLKISLQKLYRIVLVYAQTFLDRQFTMRLVDKGVESFVDVDKNRISGNLDLDIEMETLQDKTTKQQMKLLLLNQARETPGANVGKFFTDTLESLTDGNIEIDEYYQPPQPTPPEPPKVSISLKGDLSEMQAAAVYKTIPGVEPLYGDPLMTKQGRLLAKGVHEEDLETKKGEAELKQMEMPEIPGAEKPA